MSRRNRFMLTALMTLGLIAGGKVAEAVERPLLGYVNLQRAILEVEEGKRAKASLKKTFEKKQADLSKREIELKELKEAIERESMVKKDDAAARQRRVDFQNKMLELQQIFMKEQQDLQAAEQKELSAITDKMRAVIQELGKAGGYTMIMEVQDSRLLFAKPHLDLTNEVIRKYNGKYR